MTSALVLRTAGTNCEVETALALERSGARTQTLHLQRLIAEPARLFDASILVLPGGFSYGDDIAAGRVLGHELRHFLGEALATYVARGGFVLGVCNGFQALVDTGLLEGPASGGAQRQIALSANESGHYECRWVTLRNEPSRCPWLEPGLLWPVPVAHGEGRIVFKDSSALERFRAAGQIALRYVRADGRPAAYPGVPNGSTEAIAGVCDPTGRVLGLMPHPERNQSPFHHPRWTRMGPRQEGEGLAFYRRMVEVAGRATR
ncbi:MAG: phosphoribosylformylglycinamidine synthase subunit PurQ [Planctomycetes bacterium]|nr:phosphoribosylformylglycinamidine synthase subunit PurQ [Planctomycetota bacterium]